MITLILLHPLHSTPVQYWKFENESVIRVGRATDNDVVLYSAVVSRHHAELRQTEETWEIISFGANGTYMDEELIFESAPIFDGAIVRLAKSGPKIQIRLEAVKSEE